MTRFEHSAWESSDNGRSPILLRQMRGSGTRFLRTHSGVLAWALVGAAACASMTPLEPNMVEEGWLLEVAQRIARGDRLYQDVVVFTGPLPFEWLALLFKIFGQEIAVGRSAVAILHGLATAAVYAVALRTRAGALAHAAAASMASTPVLLFPLFSIFFYTTLSFSLSLLAGYAALRGTRSTGWASLAGIAIACSALCKQTVGAVLAMTLLASLALCAPPGKRVRQCLALCSGGAVVALVTLAAFAVSGGLGELIQSLIVLPLTFESSFQSPFMNFWPPGRFDGAVTPVRVFYVPYLYSVLYGVWEEPVWSIVLLTQILYALPFVAIAATAARRASGPLPSALWFHFSILLALMANLVPRTDWGHLVFVLPSSLVQLVLLVASSKPLRSRPRAARSAAFALVLALGLGSVAMGSALYDVAGPPGHFGPRVPLRPVSEGLRGEAVPHAIQYLREHVNPGDSIFVARAEPLIYFATDTRNPTPYGGVIPGMREEQQRVILEALKTVRYVVMSDIDQPVYTYYRDELPAVQAHLERYFHVPHDFYKEGLLWLVPLERGRDRGATVVDFVDVRADGKPWVRGPTGARSPASAFENKLGTRLNRRFLPFVLGARGGGIDFEVEIPEGAVFQGDVGYRSATAADVVYKHPRRTHLQVSVARNGEIGAFKELARVRVLDRKGGGQHRWTPVEVDLSRYAGERAIIRLELVAETLLKKRLLGWWGSPRIALRSERE